eukprot:11960621-Alexandrium_andersonii.AAC.1
MVGKTDSARPPARSAPAWLDPLLAVPLGSAQPSKQTGTCPPAVAPWLLAARADSLPLRARPR